MIELWQTLTLILIGYYPPEESWRLILCLGLIITHGAVFYQMISKRMILWSHLMVGLVFLLLCAWLVFGDGLILNSVPSHQVSGLMLNLVMSYWAIPLGTLLALLFSYWILTSPLKFTRTVCEAGLSVIRSIPLITWLFFTTLVLPLLVSPYVSFDRLQWSLFALTFFLCAYCIQIFKGTYLSIADSCHEAAHSLGFSRWQKFRHITLAPLLKVSLPALFNTYIGLIKDTTLIMIIGQSDSLGIVGTLIAKPEHKHFFIEYFALVALAFWIICYLTAKFGRLIENRTYYG